MEAKRGLYCSSMGTCGTGIELVGCEAMVWGYGVGSRVDAV